METLVRLEETAAPTDVIVFQVFLVSVSEQCYLILPEILEENYVGNVDVAVLAEFLRGCPVAKFRLYAAGLDLEAFAQVLRKFDEHGLQLKLIDD